MGGAYNANSDLGDGSTTVESNSNNPPVTAVPGPESITPPVGVPDPQVGVAQGASKSAAPETTSWFSMPSLSSLNPFSKNTEDLTSEITAAEAKIATDQAKIATDQAKIATDQAELDALIEKKAAQVTAQVTTQVTTGGRRRSKRSNKKRSNKRRSSKRRTNKRRHH